MNDVGGTSIAFGCVAAKPKKYETTEALWHSD